MENHIRRKFHSPGIQQMRDCQTSPCPFGVLWCSSLLRGQSPEERNLEERRNDHGTDSSLAAPTDTESGLPPRTTLPAMEDSSSPGLPVREKPQTSFLPSVQQVPKKSSGHFPTLNLSMTPHCLPKKGEIPSLSVVSSLTVHS